MSQIFHPSTKVISRASVAIAGLIVVALSWVSSQIYLSPYFTSVNEARSQNIPFSHEHHVSGLGIRCQYCHTAAEESPYAGIPSTQTCMTCHSQVWNTSPMLAPVRTSYQRNEPLQWMKVHDLPDFVYFNHSIHVRKGIGCQTCHGNVHRMPLVWKVHSLYMSWCLDCHRQPEKYIRPRSEVFNMNYQEPSDQQTEGRELAQLYHINVQQLTDCSICHR